MVVGKSDQPVYLSIVDDQVTLADAKSLWGLDTFYGNQGLLQALAISFPGVSRRGQAYSSFAQLL